MANTKKKKVVKAEVVDTTEKEKKKFTFKVTRAEILLSIPALVAIVFVILYVLSDETKFIYAIFAGVGGLISYVGIDIYRAKKISDEYKARKAAAESEEKEVRSEEDFLSMFDDDDEADSDDEEELSPEEELARIKAENAKLREEMAKRDAMHSI